MTSDLEELNRSGEHPSLFMNDDHGNPGNIREFDKFRIGNYHFNVNMEI